MNKPYPYHPYCELFPDIEGVAFEELADDIEANGLNDPIELYNGQVLDGKNRQRACFARKIQPTYVEHVLPKDCENEDDYLLGYVVSKNLKRRHFNESQLGIMAAKLANLLRGEHKYSNTPVGVSPFHLSTKVSQTEASQKVGVSVRSTNRAARVLRESNPRVIKAIEQGSMSLRAAESTIQKPPAVSKNGELTDDDSKDIERQVAALSGAISRAEKALADLFLAVDRKKNAHPVFAQNRHRKFEKSLRELGESLSDAKTHSSSVALLWADTKKLGMQ